MSQELKSDDIIMVYYLLELQICIFLIGWKVIILQSHCLMIFLWSIIILHIFFSTNLMMHKCPKASIVYFLNSLYLVIKIW